MSRDSNLSKLRIGIFAFLLFLTFIPLAYCQTGFDLTDLPQNVADYFGIGLFAAELLVSFMFLLFPTVLIAFALARSRNSGAVLYAVLIVDFVVMGFLVALGWLDYWIFLIVCLLVAIMLASSLRGLITGSG